VHHVAGDVLSIDAWVLMSLLTIILRSIFPPYASALFVKFMFYIMKLDSLSTMLYQDAYFPISSPPPPGGKGGKMLLKDEGLHLTKRTTKNDNKGRIVTMQKG